ncbi:hypothetical protein ACFOEZ_00890 [Tianweitania populi]|uniref:Uncharacterized protein n=1 Tax=Tianweitania populi TaxID=1607949 RepID=A0A8J3GM35_9HYPH|nr:hypothetical protein [Tianweitania populi]GHD21678.1 hypothetical protein GCM10016234_35230 [Tianweitania populi]
MNDSNHLHKADLLDAREALEAFEGSEIVYLTAGLPMDLKLWVEQWPVNMKNVFDACADHGTRLGSETSKSTIILNNAITASKSSRIF